MDQILQVLRHLVTSGPARNPAELDRLLGLLDEAGADKAPAPDSVPPAPDPPSQPAPPATADQPPGGAL